MVVWAEIPFISLFIDGEAARENTETQLTELILQNCHRSSICFWGIGNELTMGGDSEALYENLLSLNVLSKKLDLSRPTVMAQLNNMVKGADRFHLRQALCRLRARRAGREGLCQYGERHPVRERRRGFDLADTTSLLRV